MLESLPRIFALQFWCLFSEIWYEWNIDDRHVTPRYGDRHRDNKTDRHLDRLGKGLAKKLLQEIKEDTGMDCVCCICAELRSTSSCVLLETLPRAKMEKYIIESEETRNLDGNFYVCSTCKLSILNNKDPVRGQKEFLGLLDFPDNFKDEPPFVHIIHRSSLTHFFEWIEWKLNFCN